MFVERGDLVIQPIQSVSTGVFNVQMELTFQQDHDTHSNLPIHTTVPTYP
jgi:hypothetical protein